MLNASGNEASTIHVFSAFSEIVRIHLTRSYSGMFMCVFGFFHRFSVEETNHFSRMVAVRICRFYLLVVRILTTTLDTLSTINSLFVRPSFFVFAPESVEHAADNMLTS